MGEHIKSRMLVLVSYLFMIITNTLANVLRFNGNTTKDISDLYKNYFTPAPITFTIWLVIYILLGIYVFQMLSKKYENKADRRLYDFIGIMFSVSSIINGIWIVFWHFNEIATTVVLMLALLIILAIIVVTLKKKAPQNLLVRIPFSVYFGWITIATIANIVVFLVQLGWNQFGLPETVWTVIILIVGLLITCFTSVINSDFFYLLVTLWAYVGILIEQTSKTGWNGSHPLIIGTLCGCIIIIVIVLLIVVKELIYAINNRKNKGETITEVIEVSDDEVMFEDESEDGNSR